MNISYPLDETGEAPPSITTQQSLPPFAVTANAALDSFKTTHHLLRLSMPNIALTDLVISFFPFLSYQINI